MSAPSIEQEIRGDASVALLGNNGTVMLALNALFDRTITSCTLLDLSRGRDDGVARWHDTIKGTPYRWEVGDDKISLSIKENRRASRPDAHEAQDAYLRNAAATFRLMGIKADVDTTRHTMTCSRQDFVELFKYVKTISPPQEQTTKFAGKEMGEVVFNIEDITGLLHYMERNTVLRDTMAEQLGGLKDLSLSNFIRKFIQRQPPGTFLN
jgi:hypothetical protein